MAEYHYIVRPVQEDDLQAWFRLRRMLWDEVSAQEHHDEMLEIYANTDSQLVLVAETGGRLVGFLEASIRPFVEDCHSDFVGYLEGLFVEPGFRRYGIGRELVGNAERWAQKKGCTEMASDTEIGNDVGLRMHLKLGYEETSRLVHLRKDLVR